MRSLCACFVILSGVGCGGCGFGRRPAPTFETDCGHDCRPSVDQTDEMHEGFVEYTEESERVVVATPSEEGQEVVSGEMEDPPSVPTCDAGMTPCVSAGCCLLGDRWVPMSVVNAPPARLFHVAVWTGSEMIVWGGTGSGGGRYDPVGDWWLPISTVNAPRERVYATAVWTGSEMVVWGGGHTQEAGAYNPALDTWRPLAIADAPSGRQAHASAWTGSEMIVWGGEAEGGTLLADGGRYDPVADAWREMPPAGAPSERKFPSMVWTGNEVVVWGGWDGFDVYADGGRYDPVTNQWTLLAYESGRQGRFYHTATWTGGRMLISGGDAADAALSGDEYDPATNEWTSTTTSAAPVGRSLHTAVWTTSEMIVWGGWAGLSESPDYGLADGGRYDPVANAWRRVTATDAPLGRYWHTAVWTGSEMIVWGGWGNATTLNTGARYIP